MMTVSSQIETRETALPEENLPSQRRCLVSGLVTDKSALVRFVLSPDGEVTPDIAARLPGRGLWVTATRAAVEEASAKNLFSRAAKTKARVPEGLADLTENLLRRHALGLLGLARSAGAAVMREALVLEAQSAGALAGILLASDAGGDIRKKLMRANLFFDGFTRDELGAALGRGDCAVVGLRAHALTDKLCGELARLRGFQKHPSIQAERNGKQ